MKLVAISDTHLHQPEIPECDLLIHAGDACMSGSKKQLNQFIQWLRYVPAKRKVYVPGNHDRAMDKSDCRDLFKCTGIDVLLNSAIEINGLKIWGSPVTPKFYDWAFMHQRGKDIAYQWAKIPDDTDILVTHGPPYGHGDLVRDRHAGCFQLLKRVIEVAPRYHFFGHIHEGRGITVSDEVTTTFVNATSVDEHYRQVYSPLVFDLG